MTTISKPLFIYLQRPDTGDWVTVGRHVLDAASGNGLFRYAPSYVQAGLSWSIDPVNLPFVPDRDFIAPRYRGLHDVLRDACPDAWGRLLIQREHGLSADADDLRYLALAGNANRWGALAVGSAKKPPAAYLATPRLAQLDTLIQELLAMSERRGPVDANLRKRLMTHASLGGARPKATVRDGAAFWLVKPLIATDTVDIPLIEHATQQWGRVSGLDFADTHHHRAGVGISVVRVRRFDRDGAQRCMTISAASLLGTSYPGGASDAGSWSYPRLAEELKRIGAPREDGIALFARMVFNAVVGNDDDHPRNHAARYDPTEKRWRLAPAFDVVPNPDDTPRRLAMQLSQGRHEIARDCIVRDAVRFGFGSIAEADTYLDQLLVRLRDGYEQIAGLLDAGLRQKMQQRLRDNLGKLMR
jgi:serine/threonine-protein kinase HipA